MTSELFVKIVSAIITIITALITAYVIPFLKEKIGNEKYTKLTDFCILAVRAAEQLFTEEQWALKKEYVKACIKDFADRTLHLTLDDDDLDTLIEGCVNLVKKGRVIENA